MVERPGFSLIIGYASDMGTAEYIAMQLADAVKEAGIDATETELNDVALDEVRTATHVIVVASTFGEGEVPDNGTVFWEELAASDTRLDGLSYAVLALGDSSYELFCNAGRIIDARLAELGAHALAERVEYDCYREGEAREWIADVAKILIEAAAARPTSAEPTAPKATPHRRHDASPWTDANPFTSTALVNRLLTAPGSDKEVRHSELDLADSGITYQAGDSVAVHAVNNPELV
ncbi:MAG: flavodoxin domain-containing protein, partial [Mycolicibacterium aromaticivorans]|nr:flavodoxin domain-containing protein [Mycolicibacterium aromaticivorans]